MTVRLGVLSTAHSHCHAYVEAAKNVSGVTVVAVADEDDQRGRAFAEDHDIEYDSKEAVLKRIDVGLVCATNVDHVAWIRVAADAGVDLICEKPLAPTVEAAQGIVETCAREGVTLGVAMPVRFCEPARKAKAAFDEGEIGDLKGVSGTNLLKKMAPDSWLVDPERSGGGAIMDHSVHVIDLVRWITGLEIAEVYAETGTRFSDIDVEDVNVLSMKLEDGTPFTMDGSWRQPESWDFWGDVTLRLIGTEGVIEVDCFDQTFTHTRDTDVNSGVESVYWGTDMNEGLIRDFVAAARDGRKPAIPGEEGLREVRVVEAAYESVDAGAPVVVKY